MNNQGMTEADMVEVYADDMREGRFKVADQEWLWSEIERMLKSDKIEDADALYDMTLADIIRKVAEKAARTWA